jgi:SOS response regulatory protein OraA/RecX
MSDAKPTARKRKTVKRTPLEIAAAMLSVRPLSRAELKRKLHDKDLTWETAEQTVSECERLGFINDPDTAESYVRSMRNRGDGSRKIKMKLRLRGFKKDDVEQAFLKDDESSERNETEVALQLLNRRKAALERETDLLKRKNKALRILASKGFQPDAAFQALDQFFGRNDRFIAEDGDLPQQ